MASPNSPVDENSDPVLKVTVNHEVSQYDSQRAGWSLCSGWEVRAYVTYPSGRTSTPVTIALCPDKSDAEEIVELLNRKYS